jgi:hypothetical protein
MSSFSHHEDSIVRDVLTNPNRETLIQDKESVRIFTVALTSSTYP